MRNHAAVAGVGLTATTSPGRQTASKTELCQEAVDRALAHSGLRRAEIDAVVVGNIDGFEATSTAGRTIVPALGLAPGTSVYIVNTGGTTGGGVFNLAASLVRGGEAERVLCVGPSTFDGPVDLQAVINTALPVAMEQPLGIDGVHVGGMFAAAYQSRYGVADEVLELCAAQQREHAAKNPYAHIRKPLPPETAATPITTPLTLGMVCPVSSGATAVVVTTETIARRLDRNPVVRIAAYGSVADTHLGTGRHDFSSCEVLALLADRIYKDAGIMDPRRELDVLEIFSPYAPMQLILLEDLGMCGRGEAPHLVRDGSLHVDGDLPTNLSGGPHSTNPGVAAQLAPVAYIALQLMGQAAGGVQVAEARRGLAHSTGSAWWQFHTLAILEKTE
ncbi:thiolase family protein [Acrocarpospora catenulata]|uniref:thiolase family protein n=1 Tax=Acrocarpospora catenulata TaxID=2836182 RepID=UPI001BD9BE2A|nr:thiolase family protein [Acrocarpospora catenulata]